MRINTIILTVLLSLAFSTSVFGAFLRNVPQTLEQPDGTILNCFASGDEFHNWLHDESNFTIIQHPETGYYVYAISRNGELEASDWQAGKVNPLQLGLEPGLNISNEEYLKKKSLKTNFPGYKSYKVDTNIGTMHNLVVFIRFQDQSEYTESVSHYNNAFNGTNVVSMNSYFDAVSNNQLDINSHLFPRSSYTTVVSYQDSHERSYYESYNFITNPVGYRNDNEFASREHTLLKNSTEFVREEIEDMELDLDMNDDGYVDNIVYVIQGNTEGWSDLLWPHKWALYSHDVYLNGAKVWWYNFQLSEAFNVSVLCHEMFHSLGAPDLYRYEDRDLTPVGPWDLMAETTTPPQHMGVYMKQKYGGWINSIPLLSTSGTYTLESLSENPYAAYRIASPNSESEYFVIEYRHKTGQFESSLPGSGLIIYRVNPSIDGNAEGPPDEIYIFRPDGTTTSNGDIYKAYFSSQSSNVRFDATSNPSCFLSNGSPGGFEIQNIGTAGTTISFDVLLDEGFEPPRNLTASVAGLTVNLNWQYPSPGNGSLKGYKIFRNGSLITSINDPSGSDFSDEGLTTGSYNYFVKAVYSSPSGESPASNVVTASIGAEGKADLLIRNPVVKPTTVEPGGEFNIRCKLVNAGTAKAGISMMRLFLSRDQNYDESDVSVAYGSMDAIDPGYSSEISGDGLSIAENTGTGKWYVLFIADADEQITESDENNNIAYRLLTVGHEGFNTPLNLSASTAENNVYLSWNAPEAGSATLTGYRVYRNDQLVSAISDPQSTEYTDTGLDLGSYTYFVTATYSSPTGESEASNQVTISITSFDRPDLLINNQQVIPDEVDPGDMVEIKCDLVNNGAALAGESVLRLFFSRDDIWDDEDILMAYGSLGELDPGYYFPIEGEDILIPEDLSQGIWQVLFVADADMEVSESIESNNVSAFQITVGSAIFMPPRNLNASVSGRNIALNWQAPLQGDGLLSAFGIYRDGKMIHTLNDPTARSYSDMSLDQGNYTYYVTAIYHTPTGESTPSNTVFVEITSSSDPDLIITDASVNPSQVDPGGVISVSCILRNIGSSQAGESIMRLFISEDEIVDDQDDEIASGTMSRIDPAGYIEVSGDNLELPSSISKGLWYLVFVADADNTVSEGNEANNHSSLVLSVGESFFNPPGNLRGIVTGRSIELSWDPPENGLPQLVGYKMYRNGVFYTSLEPSAYQGYIDGYLDYGTYAYSVAAVYENPSGVSDLSDELVISISSDPRPDLSIRNAMVFPTQLDPGGVVSISCNLLNTGNARADHSFMRLFLSKNEVLDFADQQLAYGSIDPMDPATSFTITGEDLYIPANLDPGKWFVFFVADADEEIKETDEENNLVAIQINVTGKKSDLVPTSLYLIRDYANPGDMMRLSLFILNDGLGMTAPSKASFYLSDDPYLDSQDLFLNDVTVKWMYGGEQVIKNNYITIPTNISRKHYYLIAFVDAYQVVTETNENNNTFAKLITVGSSGVDSEDLNTGFTVFPVPARDEIFFHFDGPDLKLTTISIFDQLGRKIYFDQLEPLEYQTGRIDISAWQKGFYYAKIISGDKQYVSTFIKL